MMIRVVRRRFFVAARFAPLWRSPCACKLAHDTRLRLFSPKFGSNENPTPMHTWAWGGVRGHKAHGRRNAWTEINIADDLRRRKEHSGECGITMYRKFPKTKSPRSAHRARGVRQALRRG